MIKKASYFSWQCTETFETEMWIPGVVNMEVSI